MRAACSSILYVVAVGLPACSGKPPPPAPTETASPAAPTRAVGLEIPTANRVRESSGIVVAKIDDRTIAFVADADDRAVLALDATTLDPLARTEVDGEPRDLLATVDGRLFVSVPERNEIVTLVAQDARGALREVTRTKTAVEPMGMALTPDEDRLLVVTGASHRVEAFGTSTMERAWSLSIAREPRAVIVSSDGGYAIVSHAVAGHATVIPLGGTTPPAIETTKLDWEREFLYTTSTPPRSARLAYAMTRIQTKRGELIAMPLVQDASWGAAPNGYGYDDTPITTPAAPPDPWGGGPIRGCGYTPGQFATAGRSSFDVRTLDANDGKIRDRPGARGTTRHCLLPRAAISLGEKLLVACEGGDELLRVKLEDGWPNGDGVIRVGRGPSAIARIPASARAVVWSHLSRTLALVSLEESTTKGPQAAIATREVERLRGRDARELAGREIFRRTGDEKISNDGIACASCHPDGRDDDLVWSGPHGKRRPPTLAGNAARRGPFGWGGEHGSITAHMEQTVKRLGGKGLDAEALESLAAYLRAMKPIPNDPSAALSDPLAARGKAVFESDRAACATCHGLKDREPHDIGTGGAFVTPALAGVGTRRSLFHDGRFDSLEALLKGSPRMGGAADLGAADRAAVVAYLRTL